MSKPPAVMSAPSASAGTITTSQAVTTTPATTLPKFFTLSPTKSVTLVATATPKSVPTLLKTSGVRPASPQVLSGTSGGVATTSTKVLNLTGSGTSQLVRFPMTFNIPTSSNGKTGVIPVVLSPSAAARTGNVAVVKTPTVTTSLSSVQTTTTAVPKKKPRLMDAPSMAYEESNFGNVVIKVEEGMSFSVNGDAARRRRRTTEDGVKGLRYFATKVCDKVREKNLTTYNSVAEDLVQEYSDPHPSKSREEIACEQKNIRRRVYDALNVLMAINVIQKERKQIRWVGLPRSLNEAGVPKRENIQDRKRSLQHLRQRLFHSSLQLIGLKELAEHNKTRRAAQLVADLEAAKDSPSSFLKRAEISNAAIASELDTDESQHIHMPFLFVTCGNRCEVDCSVSTDAKEYELQFSEPFKIVEDTEVLRHTTLVKALDRGEYGLEEVKKAVEQLPAFMTTRFIGLLNEHQDKIKKLHENTRVQEVARAAAALEAQKHQQQLQAMQTVLSGNLPIAPAPIKIEEGLETAAIFNKETSLTPVATSFLPVVSVPNCAPIAALHSGSPVTLKPAYYIQVSKLGAAQLASLPATSIANETN